MNAAKKRRRKGAYACFPTWLLYNPPLARRQDDDSGTITAFELKVIAGILTAAREVVGDANHAEALQAGGKAIRKERKFAAEFRAQWRAVKQARRQGEDAPAPKRRHVYEYLMRGQYAAAAARRRERGQDEDGDPSPHRPLPLRKVAKLAGGEGYRIHRRNLGRMPPPTVEVTLSRYRLLRLAGMTDSAKNTAAIEVALDRLTRPIADHAGPLVSWQATDVDLHLQVNGEWLRPPFVKVALPLPSKGTTVLALYLFLRTIRNDVKNYRDVSFRSLCQRLGIPARSPSEASKALDRALAGVNAHAATLHVAKRHRVPVGVYRLSTTARDLRDRSRIHFEILTREQARQEAEERAKREAEAIRRERPPLRRRQRLRPSAGLRSTYIESKPLLERDWRAMLALGDD